MCLPNAVHAQVFVAWLQGDRTFDKVKRICDVVGAAIYDYQPHTFDVDIREAKESLSARDPPPPSSGTPPDSQ